uniref:Zinc knuckle CX2CX4HX4C domain-containing protein n=2 Tax=Cajanus cajan TaxID=3821 RepID=A0A151RRB9_CAJCA|nr:hypothetical protein KK1_033373 [Cajanus cajan]
MQRILKGGPWSFDCHLLILSTIKKGNILSQVPLYTVPFWVQVHLLPVGFMSLIVGQSIANYIGEFLDYDVKNSSDLWRSFMRIRVLIDVKKPLKKAKRIKKPDGEATVVFFKYERLGTYYFFCGLLGHTDKNCDKLFNMEQDDGQREWGPYLRADPRGATRGSVGYVQKIQIAGMRQSRNLT